MTRHVVRRFAGFVCVAAMCATGSVAFAQVLARDRRQGTPSRRFAR